MAQEKSFVIYVGGGCYELKYAYCVVHTNIPTPSTKNRWHLYFFLFLPKGKMSQQSLISFIDLAMTTEREREKSSFRGQK